MPQMMPMEWTMLYTTFLSTFLMFNIMNYFNQSPNKQTKTKIPIIIKKTNGKWEETYSQSSIQQQKSTVSH